jgi:NADPH-dependent 2,4-dienoyl-CoA reductase/sulfur reductase-like enzyme
MQVTDIAIVGSGPAGLGAAIEALKLGAKVTMIEENSEIGGQLFKQTHKFFGSYEHYAGIRGFDIGKKLLQGIEKEDIKIHLNTTAYDILGKEIGIIENDKIKWIKAKKIIFGCGASEKVIHFPGWTLPGVMGAGGAQTLVNIHRVLPGKRFLMIGSGNVGLVFSYQLLHAGAEVVAVVEALPKIGGYGVHAAKICRAGVPIMTSHTIKEAHGRDKVEAATIMAIDKNWCPIPGTEKTFRTDVICLAVGLRPNIELPLSVGCETMYLSALGGRVPIHDENMETTVRGVYVTGDTAGVEEADTAIDEGRLAGIAAAEELGYLAKGEAENLKLNILRNLNDLRSGPFGVNRKAAKQQLLQRATSAGRNSG